MVEIVSTLCPSLKGNTNYCVQFCGGYVYIDYSLLNTVLE